MSAFLKTQAAGRGDAPPEEIDGLVCCDCLIPAATFNGVEELAALHKLSMPMMAGVLLSFAYRALDDERMALGVGSTCARLLWAALKPVDMRFPIVIQAHGEDNVLSTIAFQSSELGRSLEEWCGRMLQLGLRCFNTEECRSLVLRLIGPEDLLTSTLAHRIRRCAGQDRYTLRPGVMVPDLENGGVETRALGGGGPRHTRTKRLIGGAR